MAKRGPKNKQIDLREFELLCSVQCTEAEICGQFGVDEKTLQKWCIKTYNKKFSQIFKEKRSFGKTSLRRRGFKMAHENPSVHIFYAKNFLGMRDNPDEIPENNSVKNIADAIRMLRGDTNGIAQKTD
jgi:hypothetical protein